MKENIINGKWIYNNYNGEIWNKSDFYNTKEEAELAAIEELESYEPIYIGQVFLVPLPEVDIVNIIEQIENDYSKACGPDNEEDLFEWKKDILDKPEYKWFSKEVNKLFKEFCKKLNIESNWYIVKNIYTYRIGYEDNDTI